MSSSVLLDVEAMNRVLVRCGLTQRDLALLCGVNEATISRAMHGHRIARATVRRIDQGLRRTKPVATGLLKISK